MTVWWVTVSAAMAAVLVVPPRPRWPTLATTAPSAAHEADGEGSDWMRRGRPAWSVLAGLGGAIFVSGPWGVPAGAVAAVAVWVWIGRAEPAHVRRRRESAARELPALVHLLAVALGSGCDVTEALRVVCAALPGPVSAVLNSVPTRLSLGVAPAAAWQPVLDDPQLAPLGRTMVRAHRSGASVTHEVGRLADDLERRAHLDVQERARAVGVKAAIPLGVCLLPSFLLIGVVPLVVGLLRSLAL